MTIDAKNTKHRHPLAISEPGENTFSQFYCIRHAGHKRGQVASNPKASVAYPYTIECKRCLWVVCSNSSGRGGADRSRWNNSSAAWAIILVKELSAD